MAGNSRIVATITNVSHSSGQPDTIAEFIINYYITGYELVGPTQSMVVLTADVTQAEAQITNDLRIALAAYLDPLIEPEQGYTFSDVRGLNI